MGDRARAIALQNINDSVVRLTAIDADAIVLCKKYGVQQATIKNEGVEMQLGDVVELRVGGPQMVVQRIGKAAFGRQSISCVWFNGTRRANGSFDRAVLKRVRLGEDSERT